MITKMTDPDILCWRIQISIERSLHISLGHSNSNWKKTVHYPNDFKDDRTLHRLGTLKFQLLKKQFSIEMISKMTDPNILCSYIQNPTGKDNSVSERFERSQNFTSFVRTFKSQLKKQFSIEMISKITELYILFRDIQVSTEKKQFSIEMISKMTEPCILCGDNQVPTEKSLQHRNHLNYQRTLHPLWGHSNPN